ncbi:MAG: hypothetical protein ACPGYV_12925 [Phycisphaeraceae bacterium]
MRNAIEWIRANVIVSASALVALIGLVAIGYFYFIAAPGYSAEKTEMLKEKKQRQDRLMNIAVPMPNEDPNAPPDTHFVVINQTVINDVSKIYREIQEQYDGILVEMNEKNAANHQPFMLGGDAIWPDADPTQFFDLYIRAAADYKRHFEILFDYDQPNAWNMPTMIASSPPSDETIQQLLAKSAFEFVSSIGVQSPADLSQTQAKQLYAEQRVQLMWALMDRARGIHFYADLPPESDPFKTADEDEADQPAPAADFGSPFGQPAARPAAGNKDAAGYPFRIEPWADSDQPPTPDQLWEGQVQLWVLRDVMTAIHRTNNIGEQIDVLAPDGTIRPEPASVVNSPIKRLIKLQTLPGYVGLHNTGAALGTSVTDFDNPASGFSASPPSTGFGGGLGAATTTTQSIYPTPPVELAPKAKTEAASEHFGITPTGRVSNAVFDVRHTRLVIDIESAKLPAFMDTLRDVNYLTVVKANIQDVDEYELLREGYVYGSADVVRAELILESLWFRNWTEKFMPKLVKEKLLIILPEADPSQPGSFSEQPPQFIE